MEIWSACKWVILLVTLFHWEPDGHYRWTESYDVCTLLVLNRTSSNSLNALLVLNDTSLNGLNALLVLSWWPDCSIADYIPKVGQLMKPNFIHVPVKQRFALWETNSLLGMKSRKNYYHHMKNIISDFLHIKYIDWLLNEVQIKFIGCMGRIEPFLSNHEVMRKVHPS